jgi:hypothetical protein
MQYITVPLRIEYHPDKLNHSYYTVTALQHHPIDLRGNIKGIVHDDQETALIDLTQEVIGFIESLEKTGGHKNLKPTDFTLVYSVSEIGHDGRFWPPGSMSRSKRITDEDLS